jgi:hypothetical protein
MPMDRFLFIFFYAARNVVWLVHKELRENKKAVKLSQDFFLFFTK